jgi:hypothetical protein
MRAPWSSSAGSSRRTADAPGMDWGGMQGRGGSGRRRATPARGRGRGRTALLPHPPHQPNPCTQHLLCRGPAHTTARGCARRVPAAAAPAPARHAGPVAARARASRRRRAAALRHSARRATARRRAAAAPGRPARLAMARPVREQRLGVVHRRTDPFRGGQRRGSRIQAAGRTNQRQAGGTEPLREHSGARCTAACRSARSGRERRAPLQCLRAPLWPDPRGPCQQPIIP